MGFHAIRVATWNIGGGLIASESAVQYFSDLLRAIDCDVVCLQEIHTAPGANGEFISTTAHALCNDLALPFSSVIPCDRKRKSHLCPDQFLALATLSRWPIVNSSFYGLPNPGLSTITTGGEHWITHDKGFLDTTINWNDRVVRVLNCHMVPFHKFQRDFMEPEFYGIRMESQDLIVSSPEIPTLVIGDFNYDRMELLFPRVFQYGHKLAFSATITDPTAQLQLDHILTSKAWKTIDAKVVPGLADHFLCYADLRLDLE